MREVIEVTHMPWGKFKGTPIHELPSSYLRWVAENVDESKDFNARVVKACDDEYQYREKYNCHIDN
jgi:hypothetical protein